MDAVILLTPPPEVVSAHLLRVYTAKERHKTPPKGLISSCFITGDFVFDMRSQIRAGRGEFVFPNNDAQALNNHHFRHRY